MADGVPFAHKNRLCHNGGMKKPLKLIWKIYFLIFSTIMVANFVWLLYPEADPYIFYHVLLTWSPRYALHYYFAVLKCVVALICLLPLFGFAFNRDSRRPHFWQWMFVIRLITEVYGNFYEYMFIKSSYHMVLGYGLTTTGVFILPLIPSFAAHYLYAFTTDKRK